MLDARICTEEVFRSGQINMKPIFTQPSIYKMAEQELEIISDDEMNMDEQVCKVKSSSNVASKEIRKTNDKESVYQCQDVCHNFVSVQSVQESADIINKTKDTIVELPAIIPIARGISRSVTRSNKKVYVEEIESK